MSKVSRQDLTEFCKLFNVKVEEQVNISVYETNMLFYEKTINNPSATDKIVHRTEHGYKLVISERQLERLVSIIKSKGYYHDDAYNIKMQEEELILSHPELKRLHDQYKMLLYMLSSDQFYP